MDEISRLLLDEGIDPSERPFPLCDYKKKCARFSDVDLKKLSASVISKKEQLLLESNNCCGQCVARKTHIHQFEIGVGLYPIHPQKFITFGYNSWSQEFFEETFENNQSLIIDIRLRPYSFSHDWACGVSLAERWGDRYLHLPNWGNKNYRDKGGEIKIADFLGGWQIVKNLFPKCDTFYLMCACGNPGKCHRTTIGTQLAFNRFSVTEIN